MRWVAPISGAVLLSACAAGPRQDAGPVFYPPLPELPRVQFLTTINTEDDIGGSTGNFLFGPQRESAAFARPFDVAHEKGKIYVADASLRAIVVVDLAAKKFEYIDETGGGPFRSPMGIFIAEDGYKYIADAGRHQVLVLDETNTFRRAYGKKGQFRPLSVAVDGDRVYVVDMKESEIEVLDRESGDVITKFGGTGTEEGRFQWPTRVVVDSGGGLFVTDFLNFRIQKLDRDGRFIRAIGENGNWPGATPRPKGIAVDGDGYLYVVDGAFELVQIFDSNSAEVLMGFGKFGPKPGGNWLPSGVGIDYDNLEYFQQYVDKNFRAEYLVYVVNQAGFRKMNVYAFGEWIGPIPEGAQPPAEDAQPPAES
jgi:DNA-binding beta-propeller fold protein YncE